MTVWCNRAELELFAVTARRLWLRRNSLIHEGVFLHPNQLIREAQASLDDFQKASAREDEVVRLIAESQLIKWKPTPMREFKVNRATALENNCGKTGLGMIARDSMGNFVAAYGVPIDSKLDPVVAKAQAALHATIFAKDLGLVDIIFDGDAKQIITAINLEHPCQCPYGHLIDGVVAGLVGLGNSRFTHVKREANCAAHGLVKLALNYVIEITWSVSLPFDIGSIVRKDASFVVS